MTSDFKIFPITLLKQLDFGVLPVYQTKGLGENGLALKVAQQFNILGLVAYKSDAYKK